MAKTASDPAHLAAVKPSDALALLKLRDQPSLRTHECSRPLTPSLGGGLVDKMVAAVQAIQGPREIQKGFLADLLAPNATMCMAVGGHRGMGENLWNDLEPLNLPNLWRENTIKSFLKSRQHGATFVEFDVQVTSDGVPVVWHDDIITFGSPIQPTSCQISDLSLQDFKAIGPRPIDISGQLRELISLQRAFRNRSSGEQVSGRNNMWQCFDDDELPTLEDTFNMLPSDMGLNIEVKMTTPSSDAHTAPSEVERVVSAVLETVTKCTSVKDNQQGPIVLSSFDPDVCAALCEKQSTIPVMFITTGGSEEHPNPVRMSIAAAIEFADDHRMAGIVVDSSVLRKEERYVSLAHERGLKVMTYGLENDDINWVRRQSEIGVHGAIVDDVATILPALMELSAMVQTLKNP